MTPIKTILPPNATPLQRDLEQAAAVRLLSLQDNPLQWMNNPDKCPPHILPWLAWAMSVDVWNNDWTDATKRAVIRQSVQVHRQKGTIGALRRALSAIMFAEITIKEWFEYDGDPFTFRVYASLFENGHSLDEMNLVFATIMQTKNLRSHLDTFMPQIETTNDLPRYACALCILETITIYPRDEDV
jgi:phage tail P2-like protein